MRVLFGLAALAATVVNGQVYPPSSVVPSNGVGQAAQTAPVGLAAFAKITVRLQDQNGADVSNLNPGTSPTGSVQPTLASSAQNPVGSGFLNSANWVIRTGSAITAIHFTFTTNIYTGQMQYRWYPNYPNPATNYPGNNLSAQSYTCDPCSGAGGVGTPVSCDTATGPGAGLSPKAGWPCSSLTRTYLFRDLQPSPSHTVDFPNSFAVQLYDIITNPAPNVSSYSFLIIRKTLVVVGDPQIVGMQGQDFQVHGMPDEIFNMVTYPTVQINARFTYLESAECHDNYTACFAHPGTYVSEEGIRMGKDKVRVTAGSFKKGLTVHVNGKKVSSNVELKSGLVEIINHRRTVVTTDVMRVEITNSDKFMNQAMTMLKPDLTILGMERKVLKDNERFHPEVPLHGLQGQTWRNVEYPSGLEYEGSIMDYHVVSGNIYGTDFVFNQYKQ